MRKASICASCHLMRSSALALDLAVHLPPKGQAPFHQASAKGQNCCMRPFHFVPFLWPAAFPLFNAASFRRAALPSPVETSAQRFSPPTLPPRDPISLAAHLTGLCCACEHDGDQTGTQSVRAL